MRTFSLRLMYGLLSRYNKISITLAYICVAALWLTLSELGLPRLETYLGLTAHSLETFGHIGFFLSTAITLYGLLQLHQRRMSSFASAAQSQQKELTYFYDLPLIGMAITSPRAEPAFKVNARLCEMLGYSKQELMALSWADITHPEDLATDHTLYQQLLSGECNGYEVEKRVFHKNGSLLNIHVNVQCLREENGSIQHVFSTVVDQTNAVQYAMQLAATNRLYQLLLCTNQAIARENDINMLLQSICEIAIQKGEFRLAWIGLLDQEGQLVATSHAAEQSDYLDSLHITLANYNSARPIAQAFSEGHYVVCNDIATDPETASLREQALLLNYRSFISFPLRVNGHISGTFNLYARHFKHGDHGIFGRRSDRTDSAC